MLLHGAGGDILEGMPPGQVKAARSMLQDLRVTVVTNAMVRHCTKPSLLFSHLACWKHHVQTACAPQLSLMYSQALNLSSIWICSKGFASLTTATLLMPCLLNL